MEKIILKAHDSVYIYEAIRWTVGVGDDILLLGF